MRKSTGKRLRFEVFKRDSFTCQYCGQKPPDVVLVIDHLVPVADGGDNAPENLMTACQECNQGKAAQPLDDYAPSPDAELMRLEVEQKRQELLRYAEDKARMEEALRDAVELVQDAWEAEGISSWYPSADLLGRMLLRYPVETVEQAARATCRALIRRRIPGKTTGGGDAWVRYLWGCARNIAHEVEE